MSATLATPLDVKLMNLTASALFMAFVFMVVATVSGWVARNPVFALRGISVLGDVTHNNAVTLRANVAPRLAGTFFTVDLGRTQFAFESVPWVRKAVVRRDFPSRLKVILQEHQAVGYWGAEGDSRLVNSFGEVFEANVGEIEQEALPRLNGPQDQSAQVLALYQALQPLFEAMELSIEQMELTGRGGWRARLDSGAAIEFGRGSVDEVLARTQRFLRTMTQVSSRYGRTLGALETADLRHEAGYAIRLRGVTTVVPDGQKK